MSEPESIADAAKPWHDRIAKVRERLDDRPNVIGNGGVDDYVTASLEESHERRWRHIIPARYAHARLGDLEGDLAAVKEWGGDSDVLLLGNVGAGKTHAAVALAREVYDQGVEIMFRPALGLVEDLKPDGDPRALERASKAGLLILDDLGTERRTDFAADRISLLLVTRYDDCLPTIVTSNLSPEVLERQVGERIWSRLYHDSLRVKTAGSDRRREAA
jgi:DNA replication protein DnaC